LSAQLKEHNRDTLPKNILKIPEKVALTKHAPKVAMDFDWDCAHILHHVNSNHKRIFIESLYINLNTNTMNGKSANFQANYPNFLKHE